MLFVLLCLLVILFLFAPSGSYTFLALIVFQCIGGVALPHLPLLQSVGLCSHCGYHFAWSETVAVAGKTILLEEEEYPLLPRGQGAPSSI